MLTSIVLAGVLVLGYGVSIILDRLISLQKQNQTLIDCSVKLIEEIEVVSDQNKQLQLIMAQVKLKAEPAHFVTRI